MDEIDRVNPIERYSRRKLVEFIIDEFNKVKVDRSIPSSFKGMFMDQIPNLTFYIENGLMVEDYRSNEVGFLDCRKRDE